MKLWFTSTAVVCACIASSMFAQNSLVPVPAVSIYQLKYKPSKQARRLFDKANSQLKRQHYQDSAKLLQQALALAPNYWGAQNNLGYVLLKLDQQMKAQHAFEQAIKIDPENSIGYMNLSVAALNQQEYCIAENAARTALRLNPELSEAKALLSLAQVGQGNWTREGRRLLEESYHSVPGSERLLSEWPPENRHGHAVSVVVSP